MNFVTSWGILRKGSALWSYVINHLVAQSFSYVQLAELLIRETCMYNDIIWYVRPTGHVRFTLVPFYRACSSLLRKSIVKLIRE